MGIISKPQEQTSCYIVL